MPVFKIEFCDQSGFLAVVLVLLRGTLFPYGLLNCVEILKLSTDSFETRI